MAKKVFMALVAMVMVITMTVFASAQDVAFSAKGQIKAQENITLLAPMGGQVNGIAWSAGDWVTMSDVALSLTPTEVWAGYDGVVTALRAHTGDNALSVTAQYGALCYIDRDDIWQVSASTTGGYSATENRDITVGKTLRVTTGTGSEKVHGIATVTAIGDKAFTAELEKGEFELEDSVKFYLGTGKDYQSKDYVGSGKIARAAMQPIAGDGVVAKVLVNEGQRVTRGQSLMWLDNQGAKHDAESAEDQIMFPCNAAVAQILVGAGQYVVKGQAVMVITPLDGLMATLEVDELDIAKVRIGETISISVDAHGGAVREGLVQAFKPVGVTVLDTTKYLVEVSLADTDDLLIGMHVTGTW